MPNEVKAGSDNVQSGSSAENLIKSGPSANDPGSTGNQGGGQPAGGSSSTATQQVDLSNYVPKSTYEELEKKLGQQGNDLGDVKGKLTDYDQFFKEISPLLDKLQEDPDLTQAIIDGKIDSKLVNAVLEGTVKLEEATQVTKAHEEVKKEMGNKGYSQASVEDIERKVEQKLEEFKKSFGREISSLRENDEKGKFITNVEKFVKETEDFPDYAGAITEWLNDHPNIYDIEVAYNAVKGIAATNAEKEELGKKTAEEAKRVALNAGGGQSQTTQTINDKAVIDQLISNKSNPNVL